MIKVNKQECDGEIHTDEPNWLQNSICISCSLCHSWTVYFQFLSLKNLNSYTIVTSNFEWWYCFHGKTQKVARKFISWHLSHCPWEPSAGEGVQKAACDQTGCFRKAIGKNFLMHIILLSHKSMWGPRALEVLSKQKRFYRKIQKAL